MQGKYRGRGESADSRAVRVPLIKLQALTAGRHDNLRSPTFGTFSTLTSCSRPPRPTKPLLRSSTQRRGKPPRSELSEVPQNQDYFMYEEYRKAGIRKARGLPCARAPCWYIDTVQDEGELMSKGPGTENSDRSEIAKWISVRSMQDMGEVLKQRRDASDSKISISI